MAEWCYAIVNNIPKSNHSSDLRNFFSQFVEAGRFSCFHFRHRPEVQKVRNGDDEKSKEKETTCCLVRFDDDVKCREFIKLYDKKHWIDKKGDTVSSKCFISKVKISDSDPEGKKYLTQKEQETIPEARHSFSRDDLDTLIELRPPSVMPNGNVGTPTAYFLDMIRLCRLPATIIKKLGLIFPKSRAKRKYGSVPFNYGGKIVVGEADEGERVLTATGHELTSNFIESVKSRRDYKREKSPAKVIEPEESDDDECEEWDRHEAFHNDVTSQDRTKERLYEEEIELQWEKGGSGLVFYTDAQRWDEEEGDFDAKTSDDWDLDMSVYYEKNGGDKDARDFIQMRREKRLRDGVEEDNVFEKKIGAFEKHTKGFGRKILEKQGWKDGEGLGTTVIGIADALESEGQKPSDKKGFGYHGQKLPRFNQKRKRRRYSDVIIGTAYDKLSDITKQEPLLRSNFPTELSYRTQSFLKQTL